MNTVIRTLNIILVAAALSAPVATAEVRLTLDETEILPGTPTGLTIVVTNPGLNPIQLPHSLWLVATDQDGATFTVSPLTIAGQTSVRVPPEQRTVPPGGTREFRFDPTSFLIASPWFTDGRLSSPGTYRLRAIFAPRVGMAGEFNSEEALTSGEELLTVAVHSPEDAAVWEWMRAQTGGKWGQGQWMQYSGAFAEYVWKEHPQSSYTLYAVILRRFESEAQKDRMLLDQAERFPEKSYSDQLRLYVAYGHRSTAGILRRTDVKAAADEADVARKLAANLAANSRSSLVRAEAERLLSEIPPREIWLRHAQVH